MSSSNSLAELVKLSTGVSLETDLYEPLPSTVKSNEGNKLAVCLHPWPRLGGSKDDPVLYSLLGILQGQNYYTITFNSRGVGRSTGWASFTGLSEGDDLRELVQWGLEHVPDVRSLVVVGYSHGSLITSLHPILPTSIKTSHILLSYPLGARGLLTLFHTSTYAMALKDLLHNPTGNILVIFGDEDEFTSKSRYDAWVEELKQEVQGGGAVLKVISVHNATHFWRGDKGMEMQRAVESWLP